MTVTLVSLDFLTMEVLCLTIEKESFFHNLLELVGKVDSGLPSTCTNYLCGNCKVKFCDSNNEFTVISSKTGDIELTLEQKRKEAIDEHLLQGKGCTLDDIVINKRFGVPKNYLILYWIPQLEKDIRRFQYQGRTFCPDLLICRDGEVLFALYKTEKETEDTFKKLLLNNFESHLKFDQTAITDLETVLQDEESLNKNRHLLPKLYGGGRRSSDEAPYVCRWCPQEYLKHRNRGRFQLYGNYKQHFLDHHSSDVPFDQFIKYVKRQDKKWKCKNCGNEFSQSNKVRHQAICKKERTRESSTSSSSDSSSDDEQPTTSQRAKKNNRKRSKVRTSSEEKLQGPPKKVSNATQTLDTESVGVGTTDILPSSKTQEAAMQTERSQEKPPERPNLTLPSSETQEADLQTQEVQQASTSQAQEISCKQAEDQEILLDLTTNNPSQETCIQHQILPTHQSEFERFLENQSNFEQNTKSESEQELETGSSESDIGEDEKSFATNLNKKLQYEGKISEEKVKKKEEEECESGNLKLNEWWEEVNLYQYISWEGLPKDLKVFLPNDSPEFMSTVISNYNAQELKKKTLDEQMEEKEEVGEPHQFSETKDQPIMEEFQKFVENQSTKNALHLFSTGYDEDSAKTGPKSGTAKQYSLRVLEYFKFLAQKYRGFHLDWFIDYGNKVEKDCIFGMLAWRARYMYFPASRKDNFSGF